MSKSKTKPSSKKPVAKKKAASSTDEPKPTPAEITPEVADEVLNVVTAEVPTNEASATEETATAGGSADEGTLEPPAVVRCRYCGREIPKPASSTFYQCDTCEGTGERAV